MCRYAQRSQAACDILPKIGCAGQSKPFSRVVMSSRSASSSATSAAKSPGLVPADLLIDLRACRNSSRPPQRKVQRDPLHQRSLQPAGGVAHRLLAGRHPEGVAEMADHLMRRHPSPAARRCPDAPSLSLPNDLRLALAPVRESSCVPHRRDRWPASRDRRATHEPISRSPPASRNAASARWRPASASSSSARNAGSLRNASNCGRPESVGATK